MSNEGAPIEGITKLWTAITISTISDLESSKDFEEALSDLSIRRRGLSEELAKTPLETMPERVRSLAEEDLQGFVDEIEELNYIERILELKLERQMLGDELAKNVEEGQMTLLHKAETLNDRIAELEQNRPTQDD